MDIELRIMKEREKLEIGNSALKIQRLILVAGMALLISDLCRPTLAVDWYVATNGTGLGTNGWANATNNLQGAIDKSAASDTIWVSNGLYAAGGTNNWPAGALLTNRLAITKAVTVRSKDNNPTNTIIMGSGPIGPAAIRCVYMAANSTLIGFTLTNGATAPASDWWLYHDYGAGVYCPDVTPVISNCIITGNSAGNGGGAARGTLRNCRLTGNSAGQGGGVASSVLYNSLLTGNSASSLGGGGHGATFYNCTLISNTAPGAAECTTGATCIIACW